MCVLIKGGTSFSMMKQDESTSFNPALSHSGAKCSEVYASASVGQDKGRAGEHILKFQRNRVLSWAGGGAFCLSLRAKLAK